MITLAAQQSCSCGRANEVEPLPKVHCPHCHYTYRHTKLSPPSKCRHCGFNLFRFRRDKLASMQGYNTEKTEIFKELL